jgi:hypothetical protein
MSAKLLGRGAADNAAEHNFFLFTFCCFLALLICRRSYVPPTFRIHVLQGFGISFVELETEYSDLQTVVQQSVPFPSDLANAVFTILPSAKYTNSAKLAKLKGVSYLSL